VGYDRSGLHFIDSLEGMREIGYGLRGVIVKKLWPGLNELRIDKKYIPAYPLTNLEAVIDDQSIDRLFVPNSAIISNGYADLLRISQKFDIKLKVLSRETTQLLRKANVYDIAGISLYYPPRPTVEFLRSAIKRLVDIVASAVLLLILSPVFAITAAAIFVESGRPIFFKQLRSATKEGKQFHFFKFRSMIKNADELKESLFQHNEATGVLFKMRDDPRMTTVGRFIRKFSIDELPQLLNVLVGDMSLVGPRPLPASDFAKSQETDEFRDSAQDRGKVKPGMTGLWQISGRSNIGFREMLLLDLYYVENNSLLFDLEILFSTIPVVLFGKGSY
jgi:lipopolysaccharide/colanic/teichoic acid biosynthesis glycosyltransferase